MAVSCLTATKPNPGPKPQNYFSMRNDILSELGLDYNAPLYSLTVGQYVEMMKTALGKLSAPPSKPKEYIYGLRGIMFLFGVSHKTAQQYKNTFLAPACDQVGRTIIIDRDMAVELFEQTGRKCDAYGL